MDEFIIVVFMEKCISCNREFKENDMQIYCIDDNLKKKWICNICAELLANTNFNSYVSTGMYKDELRRRKIKMPEDYYHAFEKVIE